MDVMHATAALFARARRGLRHPWAPWLVLLVYAGMLIDPIWSQAFLPTQDGPSHVYSARVLLQLLDPQAFVIDRYFRLNPAGLFNSGGHIVLALLQTVASPDVAEKMFMSGLVLGLPAACMVLAASFDRRDAWLGLPASLLSYHHLVLMGFYNFSLSVILALLTLAWWLRCRDDMSPLGVAGFWVLASLTLVSHIGGFVMLLIMLSVSWIFELCVQVALRQIPFHAARFSGLRGGLGWPVRAWTKLTRQALLIFPLGLVAIVHVALRSKPNKDFYGHAFLVDFLTHHAGLAAYSNDGHHLDVTALWWILAVGVALSLAMRLWQREWLLQRDLFAVVAAAFGWLFWTQPWNKGDAGFLNERFFLFVPLLTLCWLRPRRASVRVVAVAAAMLFSLQRSARIDAEWGSLQPDLIEYNAAVDLIPEHSTVGRTAPGWYFDELRSGPPWVSPLYHVASRYALAYDVAYLDDYEAKVDYFPVRFTRARRGLPDYAVVYKGDRRPVRPGRYRVGYRVVHESDHLLLLQRERAVLTSKDWRIDPSGKGHLRVEFGQPAMASPPGYHRIPVTQRAESAAIGFDHDRDLRLRTLPSLPADLPHQAVSSTRPATLRIAVAAGLYRVTLTSASQGGKAYGLRARVGAQVLGPALDLPAYPAFACRSAIVRVGEGGLNLQLAPGHRKSNSELWQAAWSLARVELEPVQKGARPRRCTWLGPRDLRPSGNLFDTSTRPGPVAGDELRCSVDGRRPEPGADCSTVRLEQSGWLRWLAPAEGSIEHAGGGVWLLRVARLEQAAASAPLEAGLEYSYFEQARAFGDMHEPATEQGVARTISLDMVKRLQGFAVRFEGYYKAPRAGFFEIELSCKDRARLRLGPSWTLNCTKSALMHSATSRVYLPDGLVPLSLEFWQGGNDYALELKVGPPGGALQAVPAEAFFH